MKALTEVRNNLSALIQVFRCRPCKGDPTYSNLQFAAKGTAFAVTLFQQALMNLMTDQAEKELRFGMAPPSATERALRSMLDQFSEDTGMLGRDQGDIDLSRHSRVPLCRIKQPTGVPRGYRTGGGENNRGTTSGYLLSPPSVLPPFLGL